MVASISKRTLRRLCSYSLLESMYSSGFEIYTDCFVPIIVQILSDRETADVDAIKSELDSFLPLPILLINKLIQRAVQKGYVVSTREVISGVDTSVYSLNHEISKEFEGQRNKVQKDINLLEKDVEKYFKNVYFRAGRPILQIIQSFVDDSDFLVNFPDISSMHGTGISIEKKDGQYLLQYLREQASKKHIDTFIELVKGSIIARALDWTDIDSLDVKSFKRCQVILDTNYLFSLLGLHGEKTKKIALELFDSIKFFDFKPKITDFTLEQLIRVLERYDRKRQEEEQIGGKKILYYERPSVYETLLNEKDWYEKDVLEYIESIDEKLDKIGIEVVTTNIILKNNEPPEDESLEKLCNDYSSSFAKRKYEYPVESNSFGKLHDFAAISLIKRMRQNKSVNINDPKAFFLTSDCHLALFNQLDMERNIGELAEVLLDTDISALLWFLSKGREVIGFSLDTIIAAYARKLFIDERVFKRFKILLKDMIDKGKIDLEDTPHRFYVNIQADLCEFSEKSLSRITEGYIKDKFLKSQEEERQKKSEYAQLKKEKTGLQQELSKLMNYEGDKDDFINSLSKKNRLLTTLVLCTSLSFVVIFIILIIFIYYL